MQARPLRRIVLTAAAIAVVVSGALSGGAAASVPTGPAPTVGVHQPIGDDHAVEVTQAAAGLTPDVNEPPRGRIHVCLLQVGENSPCWRWIRPTGAPRNPRVGEPLFMWPADGGVHHSSDFRFHSKGRVRPPSAGRPRGWPFPQPRFNIELSNQRTSWVGPLELSPRGLGNTGLCAVPMLPFRSGAEAMLERCNGHKSQYWVLAPVHAHGHVAGPHRGPIRIYSWAGVASHTPPIGYVAVGGLFPGTGIFVLPRLHHGQEIDVWVLDPVRE